MSYREERGLRPYEGGTARGVLSDANDKSVLVCSHSWPSSVVTECTGQGLLRGGCLAAPHTPPTADRHRLWEDCSACALVMTTCALELCPRCEWILSHHPSTHQPPSNSKPSFRILSLDLPPLPHPPPNLYGCTHTCIHKQGCPVANVRLLSSSSSSSIPSSYSSTSRPSFPPGLTRDKIEATWALI